MTAKMTNLEMTASSRISPRTTSRLLFWTIGILIACFQAWAFRYSVSADSISYLDMSDGAMAGGDWHRFISGTWSPMYPFLLGLFRRAFNISPGNEIIAAHLFGVLIFAFAFACFEWFLTSFLRRMNSQNTPSFPNTPHVPNQPWVFLPLAYSLFLWSSLSAITLRFLRPDMLMSGFVYLSMGMLLNFSRRATWKDYLKLGCVLGMGFLAKEPMLPISVLILGITLFLVESWRPALKKAIASFALILLIGSLYFVPLSRMRGHFTLGESGAYNYLVNVDRAGPGEGWYLEDPGKGAGTFLHPPLRIVQSPPAYAFSESQLVTHPLRFDPSKWMTGVHPRFSMKRQIGEIYADLIDLARPIRRSILLLIAFVVLIFLVPRNVILENILRAWPLWLIGIAGCAMYVVVHVESRYVGTFLVLIFCSLVYAFAEASRALSRNILIVGTVAIAASFLLSPIHIPYREYKRSGRGPNDDALAAAALQQQGIAPGDHVARISSLVIDLGPERIGRLEVVAEVDFTHATEFWSAPAEMQQQILHLFALDGAKAVIATRAGSAGLLSASGWKHLAGDYWVWLPQH
jgi:hypothetical protein